MYERDWKNLSEIDQKAVDNFREYIRIPSVHPNVNYEPCVTFLEALAKDVGLDVNVYRSVPKNPVVVLTWTGTEPKLSSIALNSHMDVVPVYEENWKRKPFDAEVDDNGDIYARGAQDAKNFGIQYVEAIRRLKLEGRKLKRTVHVLFVPDEETGGGNGMQKFVQSDEFKKLNVGFALDEGRASSDGTLMAYYGEKLIWIFAVHCFGTTGHGSLFLSDTSGEKAQRFLERLYNFRATQTNDDVTVNLTILKGGVHSNVVPGKITMVFDTRSPTHKFDSFKASVLQWCNEAGANVTIETYSKNENVENTKVDETNPFWMTLKAATENLGFPMQVGILSANTDARFLRAVGVPTIAFNCNRYTAKRSHGDNEYLNINVFLDGITIYKEIIAGISNI
ncbi:hypothetical protein FQR65_LT06926 [Abscondita terminalis]|nr:hypothetical protein FQR65_LT06926 [Abscondita terminalis]